MVVQVAAKVNLAAKMAALVAVKMAVKMAAMVAAKVVAKVAATVLDFSAMVVTTAKGAATAVMTATSIV